MFTEEIARRRDLISDIKPLFQTSFRGVGINMENLMTVGQQNCSDIKKAKIERTDFGLGK